VLDEEGNNVEEFEELVVLDSAGRLQVPKEFLEKFDIKGRARLEISEKGIIILPAPNAKIDQSAQSLAAERTSRVREKGFLGRFLKKKAGH
jgi:bifunctional DNA-binding transcriptional regulator/antitoxin component of YhaV-PrlF toxin-antitoxin module